MLQDYRPRFTLDQLETLFDEVWEAELEVGPRVELVEAFRPCAAMVLELDAKGESAGTPLQGQLRPCPPLLRLKIWSLGRKSRKSPSAPD
jgi:hypothetical protein